MCRTLGVSRSGYYAWRHRRPSPRAQQDATLSAQIQQVHQHSRGTYGRPRVHAALRARGVQTSAKRVGRLMKQQGLHARRRRRFRPTTDAKHTLPVAPNVLERRFQVQAPDVAWVGDITYIPTAQGFLYLCVLLDLFSRCVVGWSMGATLERSLCLSALQMALQRRNPEPGLVHHSDRGSQYASGEYQAALWTFGVVGSMSRPGNCWDNAVAESFFATLKSELCQSVPFQTHAQARGALFEYIEVFYNRQRLHSTLDYRSPIEYEALYHHAARAA
jgi:transposase InsO family protein